LISFGNIKNRIMLTYTVAISILVFSSGCSSIMSKATNELGNNLSYALLNSNDIDTVTEATPAYLLLMDSLVNSYGDNKKADTRKDADLLVSASTLYASYAGMIDDNQVRKKKLSDKALTYALRALCAADSSLCGLHDLDYEVFEEKIKTMTHNDMPYYYALGASWATWISARSDDFNAIADISKIELIMYRIVELDETYNNGRAHLYLGTLATLLPPALGGKPEEGRQHFETAIKLSEGKDFLAQVTFARQYAKLLFDRELHDTLLNEVISRDPEIEGFTLSNTLAQKQAEILLEEADDYF